MKIITICGVRPEWIRLNLIIKKLDKLCNHILVHTNQNFDYNLDGLFFKELEIRKPDYFLGAKGTFGEQIAVIIKEIEKVFTKEKPDKVLILGDVNSGISAFVAERMGIKILHLEAGNRCGDNEVPEEVNRRLIDHVSTINAPYTINSRNNLIKEGFKLSTLLISGNPIWEVLKYYRYQIAKSNILTKLKLDKQGYILVTNHRAECVDYEERLREIIKGLLKVKEVYGLPIICSVHPRTRSKLDKWNIKPEGLQFLEPFGFFDFVQLERTAKCIITDSGTVQEEACILKVPCVVIRRTTERPEIIECGASVLSGFNSDKMVDCVKVMLASSKNWEVPKGHCIENVSDRVVNFLLGKTNLYDYEV